jgi:integrase
MEFLTQFIRDGKVPFEKSDMYTTTSKRVSHGAGRGKITKVKVPVFEIMTKRTRSKKKIYRDIPDKAFRILFSHIRMHHPEIFGLICCSAFAGLRPSESCNVRRHDCTKYGPGIRFSFNNSAVPSSITIDLSRELQMRSDKKYVGGIKKEREQAVTKLFRDAFYTAYQEHIEYCEGRKREEEYGALNINNQGKCFTYNSYYKLFTKIVREELVPVYLHSEDPELVEYGRILMEYKLSPHVFRHWFTVQLVLSGAYNEVEITNARGDKSTESARLYLENKSELEKKYRKVTSDMWEILTKEATSLFTK